MKILVQATVIALAAGLGLGAGFAWRKHISLSAPSSDSPAEGAAGTKSSAESTSRHARVAAKDDSPLASQLERDLAMSSGVTRWLLWLEAMEKAGPTDFPRLVRLAHDDPAALKFVATRWAELAPRSFYDYLVAESKHGLSRTTMEMSRNLFDTWSKRDPEAVIAALNEPGELGLRDNWRRDVASSITSNDAERGLRLLSEWHIENFGPRMGAVTKWATADPHHAAEFALQYPAGYSSELAMEAIGKVWAKSDPAAALSFAATNPGKLGGMLESTVLKQWAGKDLQAASDWLSAADATTQNRLSSSFVEAWAAKDAAGALAWSEENLSGSHLAQAVSGVLKGAAAKDPVAAAALVSAMDPSPARSAGATVVAQKWFPEFTSGNPASPAAIAWLGGLDAASLNSALGEITWEWATSDPKTMATFLSTLNSEQLPSSASDVLARIMARQNPKATIDWAATLPQDRALNAGAEAFSAWRISQPDDATKWLNDLPAGDPRRQPFFENAVRALAYDSQTDVQFAAMNDTDRAAARKVVESLKLPADRRANLMAVLGGK